MSLPRSSYHPAPHDDDSDEDSWHDVRRQSAVRARPPPLHEDQQQQHRGEPMTEHSCTTVHRTNIHGANEERGEASSEEFSETEEAEERFSDPLETNAFGSMHTNSPNASASTGVEGLSDDEDDDEGWEDGDEQPENDSGEGFSQASEEHRKEQQQQPQQQHQNHRNSRRRHYYSSSDNDESSGYSEYDSNYNYSQDGGEECSNGEYDNNAQDDEEAPFVDNNNDNIPAQSTDRAVASSGMKSSKFFLYGGILLLCLSLVFSILAIVYRDATT